MESASHGACRSLDRARSSFWLRSTVASTSHKRSKREQIISTAQCCQERDGKRMKTKRRKKKHTPFMKFSSGVLWGRFFIIVLFDLSLLKARRNLLEMDVTPPNPQISNLEEQHGTTMVKARHQLFGFSRPSFDGRLTSLHGTGLADFA